GRLSLDLDHHRQHDLLPCCPAPNELGLDVAHARTRGARMERSTTSARSTSAASFSQPAVSRRPLSESSSEKPMARRTWEGSREPLAQADPLEAATPARSRASRRSSPFAPGKMAEAWLGSCGSA